MNVLLSIKPQFAEKIFNGTKKYEFRKAIFKDPNVKTVVVYASSPVSLVIGEFDIEEVLSDEPKELWKKTHKESGISEEFFFDYFSRREIAFAIKIKKTRRYKRPKELSKSFNASPPQSFCYLTGKNH